MKIWIIRYEESYVKNTVPYKFKNIRNVIINSFNAKMDGEHYIPSNPQSKYYSIHTSNIDKYIYGFGIASLDKEVALRLALKYIEYEKDPAINNKSNIKILKSHLKSIERENKNEERRNYNKAKRVH